MTRQATLQTARLVLRPPRPQDAGWIAAEIARPEVHAMLTTPPRPYRQADAVAWLARVQTLDWQFVIEAGEPIGVVTLDSPVWGKELGYWLRSSAWGKGYMTEAAAGLVAAWFAAGGQDVHSGHLTENSGSAKVLAKLGFAYETAVLRPSAFHGRMVEVQRMRLTQPQFRAAMLGA